MNTPTPECPACRITMQEGYAVDLTHHSQAQVTKWAEGRPEKAFLGGIKTAGIQLETVVFRCPKCGWLIWFAPNAPHKE